MRPGSLYDWSISGVEGKKWNGMANTRKERERERERERMGGVGVWEGRPRRNGVLARDWVVVLYRFFHSAKFSLCSKPKNAQKRNEHWLMNVALCGTPWKPKKTSSILTCEKTFSVLRSLCSRRQTPTLKTSMKPRAASSCALAPLSPSLVVTCQLQLLAIKLLRPEIDQLDW